MLFSGEYTDHRLKIKPFSLILDKVNSLLQKLGVAIRDRMKDGL